ncbi:uncharacterized protein [Pyxicephalus adspersus]|uniref:uncharacterized protein isoform X2 n=1 Tax=Pyxicephalus adspersus TaxID=30357 RepID=UPI003B58DD3A
MMENRPPLTSPDGSRNTPERCPRPRYSQDSTQDDCKISPHDQVEGLVVVKVEDEESYVMKNEPFEEEEIPPEISTDTNIKAEVHRRHMKRRGIKKEEELSSDISTESGRTSSSGLETSQRRKAKIEKKPRHEKFTIEENEVLVEGVILHWPHLFGNLVSTTTLKRKNQMWASIIQRVNAIGSSARTKQQCKKRISSIKRYIKKKVAACKKNDGKLTTEPLQLLEYEENLLSVIGNESVSGIESNYVDSDRLVLQRRGVAGQEIQQSAHKVHLSCSVDSPVRAVETPTPRVATPLADFCPTEAGFGETTPKFEDDVQMDAEFPTYHDEDQTAATETKDTMYPMAFKEGQQSDNKPQMADPTHIGMQDPEMLKHILDKVQENSTTMKSDTKQIKRPLSYIHQDLMLIHATQEKIQESQEAIKTELQLFHRSFVEHSNKMERLKREEISKFKDFLTLLEPISKSFQAGLSSPSISAIIKPLGDRDSSISLGNTEPKVTESGEHAQHGH